MAETSQSDSARGRANPQGQFRKGSDPSGIVWFYQVGFLLHSMLRSIFGKNGNSV
jgi:hypothetical protein